MPKGDAVLKVVSCKVDMHDNHIAITNDTPHTSQGYLISSPSCTLEITGT